MASILFVLIILLSLAAAALGSNHHDDDHEHHKKVHDDRERIRMHSQDDWSSDDFEPEIWQYVVAFVLMIGIPLMICCCGICICKSGVDTFCAFGRAIRWSVQSVFKVIYLLLYGILYVVTCRYCCCKKGEFAGWKPRTKVTAAPLCNENIESATASFSVLQASLQYKLSAEGYCLECSEDRYTTLNSLQIGYLSPYCKQHKKENHGKYAEELEAYEKNADYPCNYRFAKKLRNVAKELRRVVKEFADNPVEPGYVYIFSHRNDELIEATLPPYRGVKHVLRKIGMTRLKSAKDRIDQWREKMREDGSDDELLFENLPNKGWWKTTNAPLAEALIHALLINKRYVRFNFRVKPNGANEIEWFHGDLDALKQSIRAIVNAVNADKVSGLLEQNWESLEQRAEKENGASIDAFRK